MKYFKYVLNLFLTFTFLSCSNLSSTQTKYMLFYIQDIGGVESLMQYDPETATGKIVGEGFYQTATYSGGLAAYDKKIYFEAYVSGESHPWVYDPFEPEEAGVNPKILIDLSPSSTDESGPNYFLSFEGLLFFTAVGEVTGRELMVYDSKQPLSSTNPYQTDLVAGTSSSRPDNFLTYEDKLYFIYDNGSDDALGVFDTNLPASSTNPSTVFTGLIESNEGFVIVDNKVYFNGADVGAGEELRVFDLSQPESVSNPSLVADINTGSGSSFPRDFITAGSKIFFIATDGSTGSELWTYDTSISVSGSNPFLVADISIGPSSSTVKDMIAYEDRLFFEADDGTNGDELWVYSFNSPLSSSNPQMYELSVGAVSSDIEPFIVFDGKLFFQGEQDSNSLGVELWVWDLSSSDFNPGTNPRVYDFNTGAANGDYYRYSFRDCLDGSLCFGAVAPDGSNFYLLEPGDGGFPEIEDFEVPVAVSGDYPEEFTTLEY